MRRCKCPFIPAIRNSTGGGGGPNVGSFFLLASATSGCAGEAVLVTVTNETGASSTNTSYTGTVTFTSTDTGAVLPSNSTLASGVGVFSVTFTTVGTQTLTATDTTSSAVTGHTSGIVITQCIQDLIVTSDQGSVTVMLGNSDGTFRPPMSYALGTGTPHSAYSMAMADVNGDGTPDIVVVNKGGEKTVSVFLANGDGTFQNQQTFALVSTSEAHFNVASADFNGDGKADLVVSDCPSSGVSTVGFVSVFLSNGNGTFQSAITIATNANGSIGIAAADLNNDNKADIAVVLNSTNRVGVILGNGNGTFQAIQTFATGGSNIRNIAIADVNADGKPDLVVTDDGNNQAVYVLMGNGNGTFQAARTFATLGTGDPFAFMVVADINADSKLDIVLSNDHSNLIGIMLGNGNGTFQACSSISVTSPFGIAVADINGDGKQDIAFADYNDNSARTMLGNGNGTFQGQVAAGTVALADGLALSLVGTNFAAKTLRWVLPNAATTGTAITFTLQALTFDGIVATAYKGTVTFTSTAGVTLPANTTLNHGQSVFSLTLNTVGNKLLTATDTVTSSITGTGLLGQPQYDIVMGCASSGLGASVLLGNGDGTFRPARVYPGSSYPGPVAVGDLNGDGKNDIVMANQGDAKISVFLGNGDGTFQTGVQFTTAAGANSIYCVALSDLNGDGYLDIIASDYNNSCAIVLLGNGDGTFQAPTTFAADTEPYAVAAGDLNGDGRNDLVLVSKTHSSVSVLLGNGNGTFQNKITYDAKGAAYFVALGDVNGDGVLDIVTSNTGGTTSVLLGNGNGTFQAAKTFASYGTNLGVALADLNGDGKLDICIANGQTSANVLLGNGNGTFQTSNSFAAGVNHAIAVADFNGDGFPDLALTAKNLDSAAVLLGNGNGTFQARNLFSAGAGNPRGIAAAKLRFLGAGPAASMSVYAPIHASAITFTVVARDANGVKATGYTGTVNFTCTDTAAILPVSSTLTSGTGTFTATLSTIGGQTITATDATTSSITGHSPQISVSVVNSFTVTAPANATVGTAIAYTVTARDQFNATFTGYTGTVAFTSTDGGSTLPANATLTNGVGTFSVTFGVAATQVLVATDTVTSSITGTSGNVAVAASAAAKNLDIVIFDTGVHALGVLLGNGNGTFQAEVKTVVTATTTWYGCGPVADLNGDGKVDAVADVYSGSALGVLLGNGNGTWQPQTNFPIGASSNDSGGADLNGDGKIDLVAVHYTGHTASVLLGNGNGTFQAKTDYSLATVGDCLAMGDLRGNGIIDLVVSGYGANILNVLLGNGNGTFQTRVTYAAGGSTQLFPIVADVNGDGSLDIVVSNYGSGTISVLLGNGNGTFKPAVTYAVGTHPAGVFAADVNADGKVDLVVTNFDNAINVLLGNGDGTFQPRSSFASGSTHPLHPVVMDVNGDGKPDLVVSNEAGSNVSVFLGNGNGTFQAGTNFATGSTPRSLFVLPTKATISKLAVIAPATVTHGVGFAYTITSIDSNANTVSFYAGVITFTGGGAGATLPSNYQFTNGWRTALGSHVFTATLTTVGNQIITATDVGYGTLTGKSGTIKVQ